MNATRKLILALGAAVLLHSQVRITQYPTHIHLGQWLQPGAARRNVEGFVPAPVTVLWNVEKKGR